MCSSFFRYCVALCTSSSVEGLDAVAAAAILRFTVERGGGGICLGAAIWLSFGCAKRTCKTVAHQIIVTRGIRHSTLANLIDEVLYKHVATYKPVFTV